MLFSLAAFPPVGGWGEETDNISRLEIVCHWRNKKGTGAEMRPAVVSGIVTGHAPVSYWPISFRCP